MRNLYLLNIEVMNGTVPISSSVSSYACKEMRDTVKRKLQELTKDSEVYLRYTECDLPLYESVNEIPLMNNLVKGIKSYICS